MKTCQYLERREGSPQSECGLPATHKGNFAGGMFYCTRHANEVAEALRRMKSRKEVRPLREEELRGKTLKAETLK